MLRHAKGYQLAQRGIDTRATILSTARVASGPPLSLQNKKRERRKKSDSPPTVLGNDSFDRP
jgi:hypothetical protein